MTLFPDMVLRGLDYSIIKRAKDDGKVFVNCINIRDFSKSKHKQVDDYPYGGGAGMLIKPDVVYDAYLSIKGKLSKATKVIYVTPKGKRLNQDLAKELVKEDELVILCGHYEGIDERVIEEIVTNEISIGDFILSGGELAAMVLVDCITRLIPGVLSNTESAGDESFSNKLLEYPQYTRPFDFLGKEVPSVLLSGHHENIERWRRDKAVECTLNRRPDLLLVDTIWVTNDERP